MADAEIVTTDLSADARKFLQATEAATRGARILERQLLDLISTVNNVDKTLNSLKASGLKVNVKVDSSAIDRAESDIKALDGETINVDVTADTGRAEARIQSLSDVTNRVEVPVTADTGKAESEIKALDGQDVTAQVDGDTSRIEAKLDQIRNIAVIDVVLNITEKVEDAPIVGGVAGRDAAAGTLAARTGMEATDAARVIEEVYTGAYGESADEIANNIALVDQLNIQTGTLASNTETAWDTANIAGEDFANTLEVMDKLVKTGLAKDFQQASDIIVGGIQAGANRSGDFLDTLREYSSVFEQGGYSAESAVNLMVQALELGTFNTDKLGDTVKENILKINEAVGDVGGIGGTARPILEKFDLLDDAALIGQAEEVGGISAETFAARFLEKLNTEFAAGNIDAAEFNFSLAEVFGTPVEDLGFDIFRALDFESAAASAGTFEGLGAEAAEQINNNLSTAFTGLGRTIEIEIVKTLADAGIDLNQLIDDAKEKAGELGELLRGGEALPEALEIVLEMPGLANTLRSIESVMGNVYLAFLDIIAKVQDLAGDTSGAASTRELISEQGARQLAFDIKLAGDADDALRLIDMAEGRGVDPAAIGEAISGAAVEFVNAGDLERAQELLDTVNEIPNAVARFHTSTGEAIDLPIDIDKDSTQAQIDAAIQAALDQYEAGGGSTRTFEWNEILFPTGGAIDTSAAQSLVDSAVNDLRGQFDTAMDSHNWVEAFNIATKLNDEGGVVMAQEQARMTGENIMNSFADAVNSINPFAEEENPVGFISDEMQKQIDGTIPDWRQELNNTSYDLLKMGKTSSEMAGEVTGLGENVGATDLLVSIFGETIDTTMSTAADNMEAHSETIIKWFEEIRDKATEAGNAVNNVGNGIGGGGKTAEAEGRRAGGGPVMRDRPYKVGEIDTETFYPGSDGVILNQDSSAAFWAGTQMAMDWIGMGGGGGSSTTYNDNRTFNLNTSNYGAAQRGASDARIVKAINGY
jgi:phage-related minor tail protein